jgi:hypothetical protein
MPRAWELRATATACMPTLTRWWAHSDSPDDRRKHLDARGEDKTGAPNGCDHLSVAPNATTDTAIAAVRATTERDNVHPDGPILMWPGAYARTSRTVTCPIKWTPLPKPPAGW